MIFVLFKAPRVALFARARSSQPVVVSIALATCFAVSIPTSSSVMAQTISNSAVPASAATGTLDTVNVTSSRSLKPSLEVLADVTVLNRAAILASPANSLVELLQLQPGIEITQLGGVGKNSGIFVRGTKTAQTIILIDGVRLENPLSGGANLEFLPLSAIDRIEISLGPSSSFYGSAAMGGVIQIFTAAQSQNTPSSAKGVQVSGSVAVGTQGTQQVSASVRGNDEQTRWNIGIAQQRTSGFESTRPTSGSYQADRDGHRQASINAGLQHKLSASSEVGFNAFVTQGRSFYDSSFSLPADTRFDFRTQNLSGYLRGQLTDNWRSELRFGQSGIFYDYYDASGFFPFAPRSSTRSIAWTNRYALSTTGQAALVGGIESANQTVTGPGVSTGSSVYGATDRRINSAFLGYENAFGAHSMRLQVRRDEINAKAPAKDSGATTATIAYGYRFAPGLNFRTSVGSAFRAPTFDDLYNPFGPNPTLRPEKSLGIEAGVEMRSGASLAKATVFSQRIRQAIELDSFFVSQNYDSAKAQGITLEARQPILGSDSGLTLQGQLTAQHTHGVYTDFSTGNLVSGRLARRANLHGNAGLGWSSGDAKNGIRSQLVWQFQSNRIDTNSAVLAGYGVLGLSASLGLADSLGSGWYGFAKLNNLTDRKYELASGYNAAPRSVLIGLRYE